MATNWNGLKSNDGQVSEREFNRLVDVVRENSLTPGVNYRIARQAGGTTILPKGKGGGIGEICPFDLNITVSPTDDTYRIATFNPGSVNGLLPTNIYSDFSFAVASVIQVKLRSISDGQKITSVSIVFNGTDTAIQEPTPFALPSIVEILLAVIIDGKAYRMLPCGSVELVGYQQFLVDKDPPADPGTLPYTPYFVWRLD